MEHPKVAGLPDGAFRLWIQGLAHCQKFLTDGRIDRVSLRALRAYSPKRANELVSARLWLEAEEGAITVHDYLDWNESREHVEKVRAQGRERIRRLRGKDGGNAVTAREPSANDLRSYSGDVLCSDLPEKTKPLPRARGLMAGSKPIHHGECLAHGPICLKPQVVEHMNLLALFNGNEPALRAWAEKVCERWAVRVEAGAQMYTADQFKFWRTEYDRDFAANAPKPEPKRDNSGPQVPDANATSAYLAEYRKAARG
jgi:hypothetical protein